MHASPAVREYARNVRGFHPDVHRFLVYNLFANVGYGVFQVVFNLYLLELGRREDDIGAFSAAQTICMGLGGIALGMLVNRHGSWRCVFVGFALFVAASTAISFAESRILLIALSAAYGLGLTFLFNTTMPFLMEWETRANRAHAAAVAFSLISLSLTIGSLLGGLLPGLIGTLIAAGDGSSTTAYRWTMLAGTAIAAIGLVPLVRMQQARRTRAAVPETLVAEPVTPVERRQVRLDMGVFVLVGGLMALGVGMVIPFANVFLESRGANTVQVGFIFAGSSAIAAAIGLFAPAVSRKLGALDAVTYLRLAVVPCFLLIPFYPVLGVAVLAFVVRQTAFSMAWPIDSTFIGEILPPRARPAVFGLRSAAWNLGYALAAFGAGKIIVRTGYDATFVSIAAFTALSSIVFSLYYRRHPLIRAGLVPSALAHGRQRPADVAPPLGGTDAAEPSAGLAA